MLKALPNIITFLRILLTPVFAGLYLHGRDNATMHIWSLIVLGVIMFSDLADGFLARRFKLQTRLGEILDPVADKLAQTVICVCLFLRDIAPLWFMLLLIGKETAQLILGIICLKRDVEIQPAQWYGKAATLIFYFVICFNLVFPGLMMSHPVLRMSGFVVASICAYFAFVNYIIIHLQVKRRQDKLTVHAGADETGEVQ